MGPKHPSPASQYQIIAGTAFEGKLLPGGGNENIVACTTIYFFIGIFGKVHI